MSQTTQTLPTPPAGFEWTDLGLGNQLMYKTGIKELSKDHVNLDNLFTYGDSIHSIVSTTQIQAGLLIGNREMAEENLQKAKKLKPLFISVTVITLAAMFAGIIVMFINPIFALIPLIIAFIGVVVLAYTHFLGASSPAYIESEKRHIDTINKALKNLYQSTASNILEFLCHWPIMRQYLVETVDAIMKHNIDPMYKKAGFECIERRANLKKDFDF